MTEETDERINGEGRCRRRRGRPRMRRVGCTSFEMRTFVPCGSLNEGEDFVILLPEEMEAVRLVDLLDYDQESAAGEAGVSRRTLWRDLHNGRKKIADALVNGKKIEISSGKQD